MKRAIVLFLAVLAVNIASAQVDFGLKAGLNYNLADVSSKDLGTFNTENKAGFHAGVFVRVNIPVIGLYVQGEPTFTRLNTDIVDDVSTNSIKSNRFDIPVLLGYKILGVFKVFAGPVYSYNLGSSTPNFDLVLKEKGSFGYQAGVGFEFSKLMFDLKYEGAVSHTHYVQAMGVDVANFDNRGSQIILSVGYAF